MGISPHFRPRWRLRHNAVRPDPVGTDQPQLSRMLVVVVVAAVMIPLDTGLTAFARSRSGLGLKYGDGRR
jgi:hypothetical protein